MVDDLCHENMFENLVKNKNNFFIMQTISFLNENVYIFYSWKSIS